MLENKLIITYSSELARIEEKITKQKDVEMFENGFFRIKKPRYHDKQHSPYL